MEREERHLALTGQDPHRQSISDHSQNWDQKQVCIELYIIILGKNHMFCAMEPSLFALWLQQQNTIMMSTFVMPEPNFSPIVVKPNLKLPISSESEDPSIGCPKQVNQEKQSSSRKKCQPKKKAEGKDPNFHMKKQKKNRNVISNLVHHLFKYLSDQEQVSEYLQKIISIHHLSIKLTEFYSLLAIFNEKMKSYVTELSFKELLLGHSKEFRQQNQNTIQEFTKVLRVVCLKFYRQDCINSVIYSLKLSHESKVLHYQGMRELRTLLQFLSGWPSRKIKKESYYD